jgi:hypothetical protein
LFSPHDLLGDPGSVPFNAPSLNLLVPPSRNEPNAAVKGSDEKFQKEKGKDKSRGTEDSLTLVSTLSCRSGLPSTQINKDTHINMQAFAELNTPTTTLTTTAASPVSTRHQILTPAPSVVDEEIFKRQERQRTLSDQSSSSREDDYYFYHKGMSSRRNSIQSIGRRPEDEARRESTEQVRLPPISSLLASVERMAFLRGY